MPRPTQVPQGCEPAFAYRTVTFCGPPFQDGSASQSHHPYWGPTTPQGKSPRFGLFPFRSPLLRESSFLSFPPATKMFQFAGYRLTCLWIQHVMIRGSRDQRLFDSSPGLIAVFHALHRLSTPRHPPYALSSLATWIERSRNCLYGTPSISKLPTLASARTANALAAGPCLVRSAQRCHQRSQPNCQRTKHGATTTHFAITPTQTNWGHISENMSPVCLRLTCLPPF